MRLREEKHTANQTFKRTVMLKIILRTWGRFNNSPQIYTDYNTDQSDLFQESDRWWCLSEHSLFDAIWYWHILHRDQLCKVSQAVNILDFLTEFGAVKRRVRVRIWRHVPGSLCSVVKTTSDLMKGFVSAKRVRINQEGWTIIRDFRFFLNLCRIHGERSWQTSSTPQRLTSGRSAGSISSASSRSASSSETWLRSSRRSCSSRPPAAPGCRWRTCGGKIPLAPLLQHQSETLKETLTWINCPWCIGNLADCSRAWSTRQTQLWHSGRLHSNLDGRFSFKALLLFVHNDKRHTGLNQMDSVVSFMRDLYERFKLPLSCWRQLRCYLHGWSPSCKARWPSCPLCAPAPRCETPSSAGSPPAPRRRSTPALTPPPSGAALCF